MRGWTGVLKYQTPVGIVESLGLDRAIFRKILPDHGFVHALELDNHHAYRGSGSVGDFDVGASTQNLASVLRQRRPVGLLVGGECFWVANT